MGGVVSLAVSTAFELETVETVSEIRGPENTSLKRGVNETAGRRINAQARRAIQVITVLSKSDK